MRFSKVELQLKMTVSFSQSYSYFLTASFISPAIGAGYWKTTQLLTYLHFTPLVLLGYGPQAQTAQASPSFQRL